jgi:PAS domain S-box-containing protein
MANPAANFGRLSGKSTCYALTHQRGEPCDDSEHPCVIKEIKRTGKPVIFEHIHYDTEGKPMIHEVHGYPIIDRSGNVVQVIEYNLNITKRKKAEEALQLSELKNRSITTTAKDAIIMIDEKGIISFWNPAAEEIFGYTKEEALNKELHPLIVPDRYLADCRNGIRKFTDTGKGPVIGHTLELEAMKKDGSEFQVELSLSAIKVKDNWNAIGIVRDITQRKESENKILASLKEKDVLLREIHHRVKNNMQIISGLLNLQASVVSDKRNFEMLRDCQNRIKSMSLIHEKLYGSEDLAHIDINDYINDLTRYIFQFHKTVLNNVELKIDIENIWLGIDTAIPCGLIINELVSNSLKHAFPENRKGELRITLLKTDEGEIELTVSDNGIGIPEELDISSTKSLGLLLVNTLSKEQLQGKIELDRTGGTKFSIRFKEVKYKNRLENQ